MMRRITIEEHGSHAEKSKKGYTGARQDARPEDNRPKAPKGVRQTRVRTEERGGMGEVSTSYGAVYYLGRSVCQLSLRQSSYFRGQKIQGFVVLVQQPIAVVQHIWQQMHRHQLAVVDALIFC